MRDLRYLKGQKRSITQLTAQQLPTAKGLRFNKDEEKTMTLNSK